MAGPGQYNDSRYRYTLDFLWIKILNDEQVRLGITNFAQENLGPIQHVEIVNKDFISLGEEFLIIESLKAVTPFFSPFSGRITEINQKVIFEPSVINASKGSIWIIAMQLPKGELMDQLKEIKAMTAKEAEIWQKKIKMRLEDSL
ncbi:MAG: glycine cleavage system protein H [Candidatus Thorarchaeota archaeon]